MPIPAYLRLDVQPSALPSRQWCEVVERKGVGHPDTLADGIAELASIRYSQYCLHEFGAVLHHNLDKVAVLGGRARFDWWDGEFERPVRVVFAGRASRCFGDRHIPLGDILESAAHEQLQQCLPGYAKARVRFLHETTDSSKFAHWFRPRSLADLPERRDPCANDTALLVGVAPHSQAELAALTVESYLSTLDWTGTDVKALVVRYDRRFRVTVCVPALVGALAGPAEYREALEGAKAELVALLGGSVDGSIEILLNGSDALVEQASAQCGYVTLTGSAIDFGEDGMVGRGNGRHGLITPAHQAGTEALFGKNPGYHVGKVGGLLADRIARRIAGLGVGCRAGLVYDRGSRYSRPTWCHVTTGERVDPVAAADAVDRVLTGDSWCDELIDSEAYRARIEPLDALLHRLAAADA